MHFQPYFDAFSDCKNEWNYVHRPYDKEAANALVALRRKISKYRNKLHVRMAESEEMSDALRRAMHDYDVYLTAILNAAEAAESPEHAFDHADTAFSQFLRFRNVSELGSHHGWKQPPQQAQDAMNGWEEFRDLDPSLAIVAFVSQLPKADRLPRDSSSYGPGLIEVLLTIEQIAQSANELKSRRKELRLTREARQLIDTTLSAFLFEAKQQLNGKSGEQMTILRSLIDQTFQSLRIANQGNRRRAHLLSTRPDLPERISLNMDLGWKRLNLPSTTADASTLGHIVAAWIRSTTPVLVFPDKEAYLVARNNGLFDDSNYRVSHQNGHTVLAPKGEFVSAAKAGESMLMTARTTGAGISYARNKIVVAVTPSENDIIRALQARQPFDYETVITKIDVSANDIVMRVAQRFGFPLESIPDASMVSVGVELGLAPSATPESYGSNRVSVTVAPPNVRCVLPTLVPVTRLGQITSSESPTWFSPHPNTGRISLAYSLTPPTTNIPLEQARGLDSTAPTSPELALV